IAIPCGPCLNIIDAVLRRRVSDSSIEEKRAEVAIRIAVVADGERTLIAFERVDHEALHGGIEERNREGSPSWARAANDLLWKRRRSFGATGSLRSSELGAGHTVRG